MKKLENKYAALQVVPVIDKLGNPKVSLICFGRNMMFLLGIYSVLLLFGENMLESYI